MVSNHESDDELESNDESGSDDGSDPGNDMSDSHDGPDSDDESGFDGESDYTPESESAHAEDWSSHYYTLKLSPLDNQTTMYRPEQVPWEATIFVYSNDFNRLMAERLTWGRLFGDGKLCDRGRHCWEHHHNGPDHFIEEGDRKKRFYLTDNRENPCWLADIVFTAWEFEVLKDLSVSDLEHYMVYQAMARDPREPGGKLCYWYDREHVRMLWDEFTLSETSSVEGSDAGLWPRFGIATGDEGEDGMDVGGS
ncbi:hypothetical protein CPLU01_06675 [Colletotrichum plurivorum]|uniref:Uncharacterized protein n=1 Tax=Colletotrichum plurivorum TaxID=2175906 RepID=A0A8H6KID3_9PEZI|nr:hypothetical protein CPLU01_06675 [Colletotrichum plurivorum]